MNSLLKMRTSLTLGIWIRRVLMLAYGGQTSVDPILLTTFIVTDIAVAHRHQFTGGVF